MQASAAAVTLTPTEIGAYLSALGIGVAGLVKFLTWAFEQRAREKERQRVEFGDLLERQAREIERLNGEVLESDRRLHDAERRAAQLEAMIYRMGQTPPKEEV